MNNDHFSLSGKNILITGATGILGTQFCHALASSGANLALFDIEPKGLNSLRDALSSEYSSNKFLSYEVDITDEFEIKKSVSAVIQDFGTIDVLHNNAATKTKSLAKFLSPFEDYDIDTWKEVMDTNVNGMFLMAKHVGPHMVANGKGSIIQTGSIYGHMAPDQRIYEGSEYNGHKISSPAVYSASKAAVIGLTQYLAAYWGKNGIRVNTLTPGGVESGQNEEFSKKYSNRVPLGRMAEANDLTGALVFLCSDASSYITGQNLIVDGGLSCW
tara:strand:- start:4552 stop:5367 length:816 start_codon:yes stop_codon:yes gene_type:complete